MATLVATEKRLQVLKIFKGNTDVYFFFFFSVVLTFNKSFCVSDLVLEVNLFSAFEVRKNEADHENTKSDSADTGTYPQIILNLIH